MSTLNEDRPGTVSDKIVAHLMYFSAMYRLRWYLKSFLS